MKRFFVIVFFLITTVVLYSCNYDKDYSDKIVFEGFGNVTDMSTISEVANIIEEENIESLKLVVVGKTEFEYEVTANMDITSEEAAEIQAARRNAAAEYYKNFNETLFNSLPNYNYIDVYVSKYLPQIELDVKASDVVARNSSLLYEIASNNLVETVYVQNSAAITNSISYAMDHMNVAGELETGTLTGEGIKVGMIESGIVDVDNPNFDDITIEARNEWYFIETVTDHATAMASCIGGKEGIAKKASIYSVQLAGNVASELDWLIDKGVNIINCSYVYSTSTGEYSSHSASYDYVTWTYGIVVIAASGNEENGQTDYYVGNPGLAFNAITVGGCTYSNGRSSFSCDNEVTNVDKPTILNYGDYVAVDNAMSGSGTSYSCAFTTGCAALLMEYQGNLQVYPAKLISLLCAGAYKPSTTYGLTSGLSDIYGSGIMDFGQCKASVTNSTYAFTSESDQADDYIIEYDIYLEAGNEVTIAAAWLAKSDDSVSSLQVNNYVLCLFRPSGAQIDYKYSLYNNILVMTYVTQYTGVYKILLIQEGDLKYSDSNFVSINYSVRPVE